MGKSPLSKSRKIEKQNSYRADAARFFEWCRFNLNHYLEKLDAADKKKFESGKIPKNVFDTVRAAWSDNLKNHLPWSEHFAVIRKVLTNPRDYDSYMNCSMHLLQKLPKRILTAVAGGEKRRAKEIHDSFFSNESEAWLATYLQVWQSQRQAMHELIIQVTGRKLNDKGHLNAEQYYLDMVAANGTAASIGGLRYFLGGVVPVSLKNKREIIYDETLMPNIVLLPDKDGLWASEARLNRFLKNLGRTLSSKKKRGTSLYEPDWLHGVDQTLRFIVEGWCQNITVDEERWPMLCFLTTPALAKFLRLCNVKHCKLGRKDARTIEREIQRLGLVRIPRGRLKHVEKRGGRFLFT
jgi:hypothetical protein